MSWDKVVECRIPASLPRPPFFFLLLHHLRPRWWWLSFYVIEETTTTSRTNDLRSLWVCMSETANKATYIAAWATSWFVNVNRENKRNEAIKRKKLIALKFQESVFFSSLVWWLIAENAATISPLRWLNNVAFDVNLSYQFTFLIYFLRLSWPYGIQLDKRTTTDCAPWAIPIPTLSSCASL